MTSRPHMQTSMPTSTCTNSPHVQTVAILVCDFLSMHIGLNNSDVQSFGDSLSHQGIEELDREKNIN